MNQHEYITCDANDIERLPELDLPPDENAHAVLQALPPHPAGEAAPRVVYGEACRLSDSTLERLNVTFRQTPYALREG